MECVRSITFTIPGKNNKSDIQITIIEDNGRLLFEIELVGGKGKTPDLRALFFDLADDSKLAGLAFSDDDGAIAGMRTGPVDDMGRGANIKGHAAPFDVGIEFGTPGQARDDIEFASFTLTNEAIDLTLDDVANVLFGARLTSSGAKVTTLAPAAPDAVADAFDIFEDGESGLDAPSKTTQGVLFHVLANDTDADGDTLTITSFHGATNGTVEIVDGDDDDTIAGDAILYTPNLDFAGSDSFVYCVSDNNGGTDFAEVSISVAAVADAPLLSYEVLEGDAVNQIRIIVTAQQNDLDSSEFIDRIELSGFPVDVTVSDGGLHDPDSEPDALAREFIVTLPDAADADFDLTISAFSTETSNGDEEVTTAVLPIVYEFNSQNFDEVYLAGDQSIWGTGDQFTYTDNRFLGIDTSWNESGGGFIYGATNGNLKAGFQSTLSFEGGEIDASATYEITVDTRYNKTTDVLVIGGDAFLASGASFSTEGPEGQYMLDFIFNFFLHAEAGLDFGDLGSWEIIDLNLGPTNNTLPILDIDSDDLSVTVPLPAGFSLTAAWPNVDTTSVASLTNVVESSGASNNFLELGLDVDDLIFTLLGLPNPFDIGFDIGVASGSIELLDLDLLAGLNFIQNFAMELGELVGTISFEDGSAQAWDFDTDLTLANASLLDVDLDGLVEYELELAPLAMLRNDTNLGVNVGFQFDALKVSGSYDVVFDSGSINLGPVFSVSDAADLASFDLYDQTFALNFGAGDLLLAA